MSAAVVRAHHSIAGVYDSSKPVTIEGTIAQFRYVNPHPFLVVEVTGRDGRAETWTLEMDNRRELADIGFTAETIKPGDRVVVTGSLARRQPRAAYIRKLERPADGFIYEQVGSSPRIRR
jgi:hypothetical protein